MEESSLLWEIQSKNFLLSDEELKYQRKAGEQLCWGGASRNWPLRTACKAPLSVEIFRHN